MIDTPLGSGVVLKEDQIQLVTDAYGNIPAGNTAGYGLYMLDTRFLSAFELLIEGQNPIYLSHSSDRNFIATFQFVNPPLTLRDGVRVGRQTVSIRRSRFVDGVALYERIGFYNCNQVPLDLEITLTFDSDFADIFAVRNYAPQRRGVRSSVHTSTKRITFTYRGRDNINRRTVIEFDRPPEPKSANTLLFPIHLEPHVPVSLALRMIPQVGTATPLPKVSFDPALESLANAYEEWHKDSTAIQTNNEYFDDGMLRQSRLDVRALLEFRNTDPGTRVVVPSAGIPWYAVPFGRDSIVTALQTLMYNPSIAEGTLRTLAAYQGVKFDAVTEEEPGKIFHELRRGELANLKQIPHLPYYGTVDATPLFVVLFVETMRWLGMSEAGKVLYADLLPAVLKALSWCDDHGDLDQDGYVEYQQGALGGVRNQGWKDSPDSLQYQDGTSAVLPAALVEVQGYVYHAKDGLSRLTAHRGDVELSKRLAAEAAALKLRFNRDFWMDDCGFYAQALDGKKQPIASITSNAGHVLWSGIADEDKAELTVRNLGSEDMFSGWGLRTLSASSPNYNPMSYHNGSVWPHDNSLIAVGMRRYGFSEDAAAIVNGVIDAGFRFPNHRLPELFCGFSRDRKFNSSPVAYLVSCSPQAWAAAAPFLFIQTLLGIEPLSGESLSLDPVSTDLFLRYRVERMHLGDHRVSFDVQHRDGECRIRQLSGDITLTSNSAVVE